MLFKIRKMKSENNWSAIMKNAMLLCLFAIFSFYTINVQGQTNETLEAGAYIIDMGVAPQTEGNALKPYGLIHTLVKNYGVKVKWVIDGTKALDGVDFTYNGYDFKGGPFIIPAEFMSAEVIAEIALWEVIDGDPAVVGVTTTSPITVPVHTTIRAVPKWTLDQGNGGIAEGYLEAAGIPEYNEDYDDPLAAEYDPTKNVYNWKEPVDLSSCDDIFAMPHADPEWETHENLQTWNDLYDGAIWHACHAGSALSLMFDNITTDGDPVDYSQQTNFLTTKTENADGDGPYDEGNFPADPGDPTYNALIHWGDHDSGTPPYSYNASAASDPFMQFMGNIDPVYQSIDGGFLSGSEQIYIPAPGTTWNPNATLYIYDSDHPDQLVPGMDGYGGIVVAGHAYDDPNKGRVMLETGHTHAGDDPAEIGAQRIFLNFSFFTANEKAVFPEIDPMPTNLASGVAQPVSFTFNNMPDWLVESDYDIVWSSSCGGTFADPNVKSTTFTPPTVASETPCFISVQVIDPCGRVFNERTPTTVTCEVEFTASGTSPSCNGGNDGILDMTVTLGVSPFDYAWTRTNPVGSGSGDGLQITSLSSGDYSITLTDNDGTGCDGIVTITLTEPAALSLSGIGSASLCGGASGAIDLTVSGGTSPYTYSWTGGATTQDLSNVLPASYGVTVTDANGCIANDTYVVGGPTAINIVPITTDALCFGESTGTISLTVSGGNPGYTYLWNDGNTDQNRTELSQGTYTVTVTDDTGCTAVSSAIVVNQPTAALSATGIVTEVQCAGIPTGAIVQTVSGGTELAGGGYTYAWSNAAITKDVTSLDAGTYTVTITDKNACTLVKEYTVGESDPLQLSVVFTNATCPSDANGTVTLTVSGGLPVYTFDWDNDGLEDPDNDLQNLTALVPDIYTVIVTDQNGCTATISATVGFNNPDPVIPPSINH